MIDKLDEVERRYDRLEADLANPETLGDSARLTKVMKERSSLERIVSVYREFKSVRADLTEAERMLASSDADERALGKEELPALKARRDALEADLKILLIPGTPTTRRTSSSRSAPAPVGTRPGSSRRRSSRCTSATRTGRAGRRTSST
jgi:peptide chain release factor 1